MELFQLRYFLKAAERESFTRAADEMGISQPALSRAIADLEGEFGQPLFERQGRRVALTDAGRLLQSRAQQAACSSRVAARPSQNCSLLRMRL